MCAGLLCTQNPACRTRLPVNITQNPASRTRLADQNQQPSQQDQAGRPEPTTQPAGPGCRTRTNNPACRTRLPGTIIHFFPYFRSQQLKTKPTQPKSKEIMVVNVGVGLRVGGPNSTTSRALMLSFCLSLWSWILRCPLRKAGSLAAILLQKNPISNCKVVDNTVLVW